MNAELGPVLSEHKGRLAAGGIAWYLAGVLLLSGIVGLFNALIAGAFLDIPFMLLVITIMSLWLFWLYTKWKQTLTIHQLGFVHRRIARQPRFVRFDEIADVDIYRLHSRRGFQLKGLHVEVTLFFRAGGKMILSNDIEGVEQLAAYAKPSGAAVAPAQGGAAAPHGGGPSPWG